METFLGLRYRYSYRHLQIAYHSLKYIGVQDEANLQILLHNLL